MRRVASLALGLGLFTAAAGLASAADSHQRGSKRMDAQSFLPMQQLFVEGRRRVADKVPDESRQSLPVPWVREGRLEVAFFYAPSKVTPADGVKMAPPDQLSSLDARSGTLSALRAVTPPDFGMADAPGALLGAFKLPPGVDAAAYLAARAELFALYDRLMPAFAAAPAAPDPAVRAQAQEFLRLFAAVHEPPMAPYYEALGRGFLDWVRAGAR
jgi:hypothetical protein